MFQIAVETGRLDEWSDDLRVIAASLQEPMLIGLLNAPQVPSAVKIEAVKSALGDMVGPLALNLLSLLAARNRSGLVAGILDEYARLVDRHLGVERAQVLSAVPLDDGQISAITAVLEGVVGAGVRLEAGVEPELLGGLIAQVGDRVLDGSVRTRLQDMRRNVVGRVL